MKKSKASSFAVCSLLFALCVMPVARADTPLTGTAGSNLTAFHGATGAMNNNTWNQMMNVRSAPTADFGNCNALVLRCAQPKCASGGCTTMEIAYPIVSGCVMSSENCRTHGDALTEYIAAQIVANSTARANESATAAQNAATAAASAQSAQQMEQMQYQMQQMQSQMAQQNQATAAAVQAALDEQRELAAQQAATAQAAAAQQVAVAEQPAAATIASAVNTGVSADVLAREQASGQILTQLDNAEVAMKSLKKTMQNAFDYAGCDANGSNCTGPKRVRAFKQKANEFFDPYENVLDEVYDALILAQSLGVDITDIYMMLNGSCNVWGKYMCETCNRGDKNCDYDTNTGRGYYQIDYTTDNQGNRRVNPKQSHCTLLNMLTNQEDVQQNWLDMDAGSSGGIRVACASDAIENSALFRNRKKQATIDIETLQRMIDQDATSSAKPENAMKFCAISDREVLEKAVNLKNLPSKVCIPDRELNNRGYTQTVFSESLNSSNTPAASVLTGINCVDGLSSNSDMCKCENTGGNWVLFSSKCNCGYKKYNRVTKECEGGAFGLDLPEFAPLQASNALPEKNTPKLNMPGLTKEDLGDAFRQRNANQ